MQCAVRVPGSWDEPTFCWVYVDVGSQDDMVDCLMYRRGYDY